MADEKRNIEGYEELFSAQIGSVDIIVAENKEADCPYMICSCLFDKVTGIDFHDYDVSSDYMEVLKEFGNRVNGLISYLETQREERGQVMQLFSREDCIPVSNNTDLGGRVLVVSPQSLAPEYRSADHQLFLCGKDAFGPQEFGEGGALFGVELYEGKHCRFNYSDIMGIMHEERLPDWAKKTLAEIQNHKKKESVMDKLKQTGRNTAAKEETKNKKHNREGQEH